MKYIGYIILGYLALDLIGFIAWTLSGQMPADSFYVGSITAALLKIVI